MRSSAASVSRGRDRPPGSHRPARGLSATCLWREEWQDHAPTESARRDAAGSRIRRPSFSGNYASNVGEMGPARQPWRHYCLMRGTIGEIVAAPGGAELSIDVLNESVAVAMACGQKPSEKVLSPSRGRDDNTGIFVELFDVSDLRNGAQSRPITSSAIHERGSAQRVTTPLLKALSSISAFIRTGSRRIKASRAPISFLCGQFIEGLACRRRDEDVAAVLSKKRTAHFVAAFEKLERPIR